jgi:protease-4
MSEAQREAQDAVLDDTFGRVVTDLSHARDLGGPRVRELVDHAVLTSFEAKDSQLVDGICWPDELERIASERAGRKLRLGDYRHEKTREAQRWGPRPVIAVVPLQGTIVTGRSRGGPVTGQLAGADTIGREIRRAAEDRRVKAIVLRIDSPGGDALASDLLWREVAQARMKKPVIASLGDAAASGGYLVAVAAGDLVAEPSTLTGSIGVFALKPDLSGLLGKLGVNVVTLRRGAKADLASPTRAWTPEERALLERQIQAFYAGFKARVAEGRRLSPEQVEEVAQGRVWTGAQAQARGLVDELGTLADAVALASRRAGLSAVDDPDVVRFEPRRRFLENLAQLASADEQSFVERVATALPEVRAAAVLLEMGEQVALPVEWLGPDPVEH